MANAETPAEKAPVGSHAFLAAGSLVGAGALIIVAFTRGGSPAPPSGPGCVGGVTIADTWNEETANRLASAAAKTDAPFATSSFTIVRRDLDRYAETWTAAHEQTCGENPPVDRDGALNCLARRKDRVAAFVAGLEQPDPVALQRAWRASVALPPIEDCARPKPTTSNTDATVVQRLDAAGAMIDLGRFDDAAATLDELQLAEDEPEAARAHLLRGLLLAEIGLAKEGAAELEATVWRATGADLPGITFQASIALARVVSLSPARVDEARRWWNLASATAERLIDSPLRQYALLTTRAILLHREGKLDAALALYEPSLSLGESTWGEHHPVLLEGLGAAAIAAAELGQVAPGEQLATRGVLIAKQSLGATHPETAEVAAQFGAALVRSKRPAEGAVWLEKAVELRGAGLGADEGVRLRTSAGNAWSKAGEFERAEAAFSAARSWFDDRGANPRLLADVELGLAAALRDAGKATASIEHLRAAVAAQEQATETAPAQAIAVRIQLGQALRDQLRFDEARVELVAAKETAARELGASDPYVGDANLALADVALASGAATEALDLSQQAVALLAEGRGADDPSVHLALTQLGAACLGVGRDREAVAAFERAIAVAKAANIDAGGVAASQLSLATALWRVGEEARAQAVAQQARTTVADANPATGVTAATVDEWFSRRKLD